MVQYVTLYNVNLIGSSVQTIYLFILTVENLHNTHCVCIPRQP